MPNGTVDRRFRGANSGSGANLTFRAIWGREGKSREGQEVEVPVVVMVVVVSIPVLDSWWCRPTGDDACEDVRDEGISSDRVLEKTTSSVAAVAGGAPAWVFTSTLSFGGGGGGVGSNGGEGAMAVVSVDKVPLLLSSDMMMIMLGPRNEVKECVRPIVVSVVYVWSSLVVRESWRSVQS